MNSISENLKSTRYLPHKIENRVAAVKMLRNSPRGSIDSICRKYHIIALQQDDVEITSL